MAKEAQLSRMLKCGVVDSEGLLTTQSPGTPERLRERLAPEEEIAFPQYAALWKVCTIISNLTTGFTCWDGAIGLVASGKLGVAKIIAKGGKQ